MAPISHVAKDLPNLHRDGTVQEHPTHDKNFPELQPFSVISNCSKYSPRCIIPTEAKGLHPAQGRYCTCC